METQSDLTNAEPGPSSFNSGCVNSAVTSTEKMISDNTDLHEPGCSFYLWNVIHRKNLLIDERVKEELYNFFKLKKGRGRKPKNYNEVVEDQAIRDKAQAYLSGGVVRDYLNGSKEVYELFKDNQLKKCNCPRATIVKSNMEFQNNPNPSNTNNGSLEPEANFEDLSCIPTISIPETNNSQSTAALALIEAEIGTPTLTDSNSAKFPPAVAQKVMDEDICLKSNSVDTLDLSALLADANGTSGQDLDLDKSQSANEAPEPGTADVSKPCPSVGIHNEVFKKIGLDLSEESESE